MINKDEIIVVAGLARCGTSLVLQMLNAAGVPIYGPEEANYPAFEHPATMFGAWDDTSWLPKARGTAFKVIDPLMNPIPPGHTYRVIWLDRDPVQQAISTIKFLNAVISSIPRSKEHEAAMEASLLRDRGPAFQAVSRISDQILALQFEDLIASPERTATAIAEFLGIDSAMVPVMAGQVVKRTVGCYPGLLEVELMEREA